MGGLRAHADHSATIMFMCLNNGPKGGVAVGAYMHLDINVRCAHSSVMLVHTNVCGLYVSVELPGVRGSDVHTRAQL